MLHLGYVGSRSTAGWTVLILSSVLSILAVVFSAYSGSGTKTPPRVDHVRGRNNTLLVITDSHGDYSNVVLAAVTSLLEKHPEVEIHRASYAKQRAKVQRISDLAQARAQANEEHEFRSRPIIWYTIPGMTHTEAFASVAVNGTRDLVAAPKAAGMKRLASFMDKANYPWTDYDDTAVHNAVSQLIADIDPAVLMLDHMMSMPLASHIPSLGPKSWKISRILLTREHSVYNDEPNYALLQESQARRALDGYAHGGSAGQEQKLIWRCFE